MREETVKALQELAKVVGGPNAIISHINFGESEDYTEGFNVGYEDAADGLAFKATYRPPQDDPWRDAYLRGYESGWDCWHQQQWDNEQH